MERELLALTLALQHFALYVPIFRPAIKVYTDRHPLKYLNSLLTKNPWFTLLTAVNTDGNCDIYSEPVVSLNGVPSFVFGVVNGTLVSMWSH